MNKFDEILLNVEMLTGISNRTTRVLNLQIKNLDKQKDLLVKYKALNTATGLLERISAYVEKRKVIRQLVALKAEQQQAELVLRNLNEEMLIMCNEVLSMDYDLLREFEQQDDIHKEVMDLVRKEYNKLNAAC